MRYTGSVNSLGLFVSFFFILIVLLALFWFLPKLRRNVELNKVPAFSCRALVVFGPWYMKTGGIYRVAVYDDFFLMIFFRCQKIRYFDVKNLRLENNAVLMSVHGIHIKIFGGANELHMLYTSLQSKIDK